ncbi:MAG: sulfotransferase domain-containing protein [Nitrosopumilus sp.]|uniref:sulfotransferase domain-containing protein n=1 Tax=Nitrosopumilus sp. TaxID=2024843 RepID=UPI00247D0FD3|nr:sulfotransferase domain-containing protein [Nitrosopumilus sp.]MCV0393502.1 sulfotransferase domain-containing protein [Nitrosopumilus sp.]
MSSRIHVLVSAMPKSGSTWLTKLIENLPTMNLVQLVPSHDRREQELSIDFLERFNDINYVSHQHTRFSKATKTYLEKFSIKPVIIVRNIFDVVESFYDHFKLFGTPIPMAFVPEDILKWDKIKAFEFIVDMIIPWYFNFYCSWEIYDQKFLITYEELKNNPKHVLSAITEFAKIPCTINDIELSVEKTSQQPTRRNVCISGRGTNLPEHLKKRIYEFSEYYPNSDFSLLGLIKK